MKKFNDLRIGTKLSITMSSAICIILLIFGLYTIRSQRNSIVADSDSRLYEQVGAAGSVLGEWTV